MKRFRLVTDFNAIALGLWLYVEDDVVISLHVFHFALEFVILEAPEVE